jgi:Tol biopolymer transport system component
LPTFDGFPMFSPDGKKLVFATNRWGKVPGETNLFVVDWVEQPPDSQSGGRGFEPRAVHSPSTT